MAGGKSRNADNCGEHDCLDDFSIEASGQKLAVRTGVKDVDAFFMRLRAFPDSPHGSGNADVSSCRQNSKSGGVVKVS